MLLFILQLFFYMCKYIHRSPVSLVSVDLSLIVFNSVSFTRCCYLFFYQNVFWFWTSLVIKGPLPFILLLLLMNLLTHDVSLENFHKSYFFNNWSDQSGLSNDVHNISLIILHSCCDCISVSIHGYLSQFLIHCSPVKSLHQRSVNLLTTSWHQFHSSVSIRKHDWVIHARFWQT